MADVVGATPGDLGDAVVIVSGYNDDARRFRRDATGVLTQLAAQGVPRIVWLDLRVTPAMPAATQARHRAINATLASLDRASPLLRVASWNAHSAGRDAWFFDPIHLRSAGAVELARFVRAQLAGISAGGRAGAPATRVRSRAGQRRRNPSRSPAARHPAAGWNPQPAVAVDAAGRHAGIRRRSSRAAARRGTGAARPRRGTGARGAVRRARSSCG